MVRGKYGLGSELIPEVHPKSFALSIWRGIINIWPHIKWIIGHGDSTHFWGDQWLDE